MLLQWQYGGFFRIFKNPNTVTLHSGLDSRITTLRHSSE
ncbi:hypothetical protein CHCC14809_4508 [Bacillus licheniformis]|nr:hypothetical protein CHCC20369_3501 [Bacillus licheniformis]TWK37330.1 hypothetical protein CHCC20368_1855 [Bacillus licheniformis]TWM20791.1 hypothetical protein CHCC15087_2900 [Bacillus licheniformis]TWM78322.1 hypothetical protein CHCC14809_4508 [Bacillus licheniformis]TWM90298.1 hypothetical protein CHCC14598_3983 [Bacillus licheniformis]